MFLVIYVNNLTVLRICEDIREKSKLINNALQWTSEFIMMDY